jgi:hypothetical protein
VEQVTILAPDESLRVNTARLRALEEDLGAVQADRVIGRAMEALAVRLARTERAYSEGDMQRITKDARALGGIADQVGLESLARVALDVAGCAAAGDGPALAATLMRLQRLGDRSLSAVWDLQGMTV